MVFLSRTRPLSTQAYRITVGFASAESSNAYGSGDFGESSCNLRLPDFFFSPDKNWRLNPRATPAPCSTGTETLFLHDRPSLLRRHRTPCRRYPRSHQSHLQSHRPPLFPRGSGPREERRHRVEPGKVDASHCAWRRVDYAGQHSVHRVIHHSQQSRPVDATEHLEDGGGAGGELEQETLIRTLGKPSAHLSTQFK